MDADTQQFVIEAVSDREIGALVDDLSVDDAVDMLEEMPASLVKRVLKNASPGTRERINEFLRYPEDSAGSIMTAEFTDLKKGMTVEDAIKRIRRTGENRETVYTCYVMDDTRHLEGVVTVKDLLLADDNTLVDTLMATDVKAVHTTADREEAAGILAKYGFISLPVVDAEGRLVGIVTVDDAVDVIQAEATEDFERMAAMAPSEKPYLKTGVFRLACNRFVWLLVLMVSGMITGGILGGFESAIRAIPMLVTFIPMLTDTGGNAGSQSSTLVIRGMALGQISPADAGAVFFKELRVSLTVGLPLAAVNFLRVVLFNPGRGLEAATVSLAMICTVIFANLTGGLLPILAKRLRIDPATMATPLITTLVDVLSLVIFFCLAYALLPI
jgi:magnesium transporter